MFETLIKLDESTCATLCSGPRSVFFHAAKEPVQVMQAGHFKLFNGIAETAQAAGLEVHLCLMSLKSVELAAQPQHLNIFFGDRPYFGQNCFHSTPTYLNGYWYFDEIAVRNNSSQRIIPFRPHTMDRSHAEQFHSKLFKRFVTANKSKFDQSKRDATLKPGGIFMPLQCFTPEPYAPCHTNYPDLIRQVIAVRGNRNVYLKPHPRQTYDEMKEIMEFQDQKAGIIISDASIHDHLAACEMVVTLNSAVGFEAFLHKKPVVLAGLTDFAQCATTVTTLGALAAAMDSARHKKWQYEKFLVWFLQHNCIEEKADNALARVLARIHAKGFEFADLDRRGFY